jgi:hypothetical protein
MKDSKCNRRLTLAIPRRKGVGYRSIEARKRGGLKENLSCAEGER